MTPRILRPACLLLLLLALGGCGSARIRGGGGATGEERGPGDAATGGRAGKEGFARTVRSAVTVSASGAGKPFRGKGYLLFKSPDRLRLAFLTPFGTTAAEVYAGGGSVAVSVPSRRKVYEGKGGDFPDGHPLRSLDRMAWAASFPDAAGDGELLERDDRGRLVRRVSPRGDEATYDRYEDAGFISFPRRVRMKLSSGERAEILFDDPEVDGPVDDGELALPPGTYERAPLAELLLPGLPAPPGGGE